jgi:hypothetical protein
MKPNNQLNKRKTFKDTNNLKLGIKDTYVPPPQDTYSWSIDKMIQCWADKDKDCFWDNLLWYLENKEERKEYVITFDAPFSPDGTGDIGATTRCITSTRPTVKDPSLNRKFLTWVRQNTIGGVKKVDEDYYFHCSHLGTGAAGLMDDACKASCNALKSGGTCGTEQHPRDVQNMGFEQAGCDGQDIYCWCNSSNQFKKF